MSREEKKQVAKIAVFLTSIFVIFLSVSYAFIHVTLTGTRRHIIRAGNLRVELEEENAIILENAFPMYDEVGMIQEPFVFHVDNLDELRVNYTIRLEDITEGEEKLATSDVKFGLKRGEDTTIDLLSNIEGGVIEEGTLGKKESTTYELRLWIRDGVTENEAIAGKSLRYKIAVDVTGMVESDAPAIEILSDLIAGSSSYVLQGKVTDESRVASVFINEEEVEVLEDGTFSKELTLKDGNNEITISAVDMWGNEKEEKYTVVYDVESPSLTVNAPTSSSSSSPIYTTSSNYTVSGTASDLSGIKSVTVNGQAATLEGSVWSYNLALSANTTTTVTIVATDTVGKTTTQTRYLFYDTANPSLSVSAPTSTNSASPTSTTSSSYTVSGTASDASGIASVTVNGHAASLSGNNWSYNLGLSANTTTTVTIVAKDKAGRTTTQTRYVLYDNTNPSLSVSAPTSTNSASPTYVTSSSYTVSGTASDASGIASVTVNGQVASLSGNNWSKTISLATGQTNTITIVATDKTGRTTTAVRYVHVYQVQDITYLFTRTHNFQTGQTWGTSGSVNTNTRTITMTTSRNGSGGGNGVGYADIFGNGLVFGTVKKIVLTVNFSSRVEGTLYFRFGVYQGNDWGNWDAAQTRAELYADSGNITSSGQVEIPINGTSNYTYLGISANMKSTTDGTTTFTISKVEIYR